MSLEKLINTKKRYKETLSAIRLTKLKLIVPVLATITVVLNGYYDEQEFQHNINTKDRFICKSSVNGGFIIIVDKKDGWILKDNHFLKDNNTISANRCKAVEEKSDDN